MRRYSLGVTWTQRESAAEVARRAEAKLECQFGHGDFGVRQCIACCLIRSMQKYCKVRHRQRSETLERNDKGSIAQRRLNLAAKRLGLGFLEGNRY